MIPPLLTVVVRNERDVVLARQRGREIAALLGFDPQDQVRIATALSEIARNAFLYAGGGTVEFRIEGTTVPQLLVIRVRDEGPGIAHLQAILDGEYRSATGMGRGILGARRLVDRFEIESGPGKGTTAVLKKLLPPQRDRMDEPALAALAMELSRHPPRDPIDEIQRQNQELLGTLAQLTERQEELIRLNRELEDTNRGVVALYAELDERADHLRRADEIKTRFISNLSHEFRTPVNSIQALARLLLDRTDGDLGPEQERQVTFIRKSADALAELVSDLLDLARVEAGKTVVRPTEFEVAGLFGALRGMLRPLLVNESVNLVFDEPEGIAPLYTDEGKVSQILRNLISNALKFTERGEVRVTVRTGPAGVVLFTVADTGIGILPEDQELIFQEFAQVDSPLQRRVLGTGLGLPLCRKLTELLGGTITVESRIGIGSIFTAAIPAMYEIHESYSPPEWTPEPEKIPVLVVEDSLELQLVYEKYLAGSKFQMLGARSLREARTALVAVAPHAIVLDILLSGEDSWGFLSELKRRPDTRRIPVIVVSTVEDEAKGMALGADAYCMKPLDRQRLLRILTQFTAGDTIRRILVVDDEEISRYVMCQHLMAPHHQVLEATNGRDAVKLAQTERPDLVCLDLSMPEMDGAETLRRLRAHPATRDIPVVIVTGRILGPIETRELLNSASGILSKNGLSRECVLSAIERALATTEVSHD